MVLLVMCILHLFYIFLNTSRLHVVEVVSVGEKKRCRKRREQYEPSLVARKVLNNRFLRMLTHLVYSAKVPIAAGKIAKQISILLGRDYSPAYVSVYLRKLEKWGVVKAYKDPSNGHIVWWKADTKARELIEQELVKEEYLKVMRLAGEEVDL